MNEKIFELYIDNEGKFIIEENPNFQNSFDWLNKTIPYSSYRQTYIIYCDETHLEKCKKKLLKYYIKEQEDIIKNAETKLKFYESITA